MKIQIRNYFGTVLFEGDFLSLAEALRAAAKSGADLSGADLRNADLSGAVLRNADLRNADLRNAVLSGAVLRNADLSGAVLKKKDVEAILSQRTIVPEEGDLIGYKKLGNGTIAKLRIPDGVLRLGGLVGRKCRAASAVVLEGEGCSSHDSSFHYFPGNTVAPSKAFDPNPLVECASGIHFFITRAEAEAYSV